MSVVVKGHGTELHVVYNQSEAIHHHLEATPLRMDVIDDSIDGRWSLRVTER